MTNEKREYFFLMAPLLDNVCYRIPREVFLIKRYRKTSADAKFIYAMLLSNSEFMNIDGQGVRYAYYTISMICNFLDCTRSKANEVVQELKTSGLIEVSDDISKRKRLVLLKNIMSNSDNERLDNDNNGYEWRGKDGAEIFKRNNCD